METTPNKETTTMIQLDTTKRAARMIEAGRVTTTFRSPSGRHITLTAKCRGKVNGKWTTTALADALVIFIEVPSDGGWNDKVGKINRGGFTADRNADEARIFCAKQLLAYLAGQPTAPGLEIFEEERCGRCGRALTDPTSIERGIGPECYGRMTGSEHATKAPRRTENTGGMLGIPAIARRNAPKHETPATAAEAAHLQAEADGTHAYAQAEIAADQAAFEAGLDREVRRDAKGVPMGVGDWRARAAYLEQARSDDQPKRTTKAQRAAEALAACSQITELPGETFEDIFTMSAGPNADQLQARLDANREGRSYTS